MRKILSVFGGHVIKLNFRFIKKGQAFHSLKGPIVFFHYFSWFSSINKQKVMCFLVDTLHWIMLKEWGVLEIIVLGWWGFPKISTLAKGAYFGNARLLGHYPTQEVAIDVLAQLETWKIHKWQCPNGEHKLKAITSFIYLFIFLIFIFVSFRARFCQILSWKIMILTYTKDFLWKIMTQIC
jgi:hypothetical protein